MTRLSGWLPLLLLSAVAGCASAPEGGATPGSVTSDPPTLLVGDFEDDYGNRFTISSEVWLQRPRSRYSVVSWVPSRQYLIARNHPDNPSSAGLWTRIHWLELEGTPPWRWGFCLSAYSAASREVAEATDVVDRSDPRTGCNGWPFSRMRPLEDR